MNRPLLLMTLAAAIVLFGVYYFFSQGSGQTLNSISNQKTPTKTGEATSQQATSNNQATLTVEYTNAGFIPSSLTIKSGESVQWVNKADREMWIASSPHPTHTDYPGFDELTGVSNGGSYVFTFDKTGTWNYHNHLNAKMRATVIVE